MTSLNEDLYKDLRVVPPIINTTTKVRQQVVAITTSSARTNLAALMTGLAGDGALDGQYLDFTADGGNVYLFFNNADAGTIDETATGAGVTVAGGVIFNGQTKPYIVPNGYTWIVAKGSAACNLRIAVSSQPPTRRFGTSAEDM